MTPGAVRQAKYAVLHIPRRIAKFLTHGPSKACHYLYYNRSRASIRDLCAPQKKIRLTALPYYCSHHRSRISTFQSSTMASSHPINPNFPVLQRHLTSVLRARGSATSGPNCPTCEATIKSLNKPRTPDPERKSTSYAGLHRTKFQVEPEYSIAIVPLQQFWTKHQVNLIQSARAFSRSLMISHHVRAEIQAFCESPAEKK